MSKMKSILGMHIALAAMTMSDLDGNKRERFIEYGETEEERKARLYKVERERYKAKGLIEFFYGDESVWALNKKVANKKARKRNLL